MESFRRYLERRVWLGLGAALLGGCAHLCSGAVPARSVDGLAEVLGNRVGGTVDPATIAWEPSGGAWRDLVHGRGVLFLAAPEPGAPHDVFRARVQVTREGQPLRLRALRNLSRSPIGDDVGLRVRAGRAVFATVAYGDIQAVTVLDLEGTRPEDRPRSLLQQWMVAVNDYQRTASVLGLGRTDIVFDAPTSRATLRFDAPHLRIEIAGEGRTLEYDVAQRQLRAADGGDPYGARLITRSPEDKPVILWGVDTLRAEVGPAPVAWLESVLFGARDLIKRNAYSWFGSTPTDRLREVAGGEDVAPVEEDAGWPPPPLPSIWQRPEPGEGAWEPVNYAFLPQSGRVSRGEESPYFYRTFVRPDSKRPYSRLLLIAMDARRLELGVQAGYEDPEPLTGPMGTGRLPSDPEVVDRVVATFNGAFKTDHGEYGMMVDRRVLLPPVPNGATVVMDERGGTGFGNWPASAEIPTDLVSFRQNLDPLVEDGVVNPSGRYVWGWQLHGSTVMTQRSALCLTGAGHIIYAFGEELDGAVLARGLRQAGCSYAIHLDMNPGHCGFVFTDVIDLASRRYQLQKASDAMQIPADKYVYSSAKDFFYVLLRDPRPPRLEGVDWVPDPGAQPDPASIPAVFAGTLRVGGLEVELQSFAPQRFTWRIRAGDKEPQADDRPPMKTTLAPTERERAVAAIGCGHTTPEAGLGISFHQSPSIPLRSDSATLVVNGSGEMEIIPPVVELRLQPGDEAVQLPLLADEGELLPRGREPGPMRRRGALCITEAGRLLVARVEHDTAAPAVAALLRAGCRRVVELERGSHHAAFVHRGGTSTPPVGRYPVTVLYALSRPMPPRAYRWRPPGSGASTHPSTPDVSRDRALRQLR